MSHQQLAAVERGFVGRQAAWVLRALETLGVELSAAVPDPLTEYGLTWLWVRDAGERDVPRILECDQRLDARTVRGWLDDPGCTLLTASAVVAWPRGTSGYTRRAVPVDAVGGYALARGGRIERAGMHPLLRDDDLLEWFERAARATASE